MSVNFYILAGVTALYLCCLSGAAAEPSLTATLSIREQYDGNVYLQDEAPLALGQTTAAVPANAGSFITSLGASLGWSWKPTSFFRLDITYAPEAIRYAGFSTENHTDHRFSLNAKGTDGAWRHELKAGWLGTIGSHESPVFNRQGGAPPVGSEPVRSRRAQDIYKANGRFTRDFSPGFVRGVFFLSDQDFHTRHSPAPGYANYVDRGEWSAGAELGWKIKPELALVTAIRGGRQHQEDLLGVPLNYSNRLTRWLLGAEGKLHRTLNFNVLAGPDIREFGPAVRPGFDRHQTTSYLEAGATWTPSKLDVLTFSGRRSLWLSSGGRGGYLDALYDLSWTHQIRPTWSMTSGVNLHTAVSRHYNSPLLRDDIIWAVSGVLSHPLNRHTRVDFSFLQDWSQSQIPETAGREYHRRIYSLGLARLW